LRERIKARGKGKKVLGKIHKRKANQTLKETIRKWSEEERALCAHEDKGKRKNGYRARFDKVDGVIEMGGQWAL